MSDPIRARDHEPHRAVAPADTARRQRITHRHVTSEGVAIHVAECGEGPLVVFVHGMADLWYTWRHQLIALAAAGYRAIAIDLRGIGDSGAPPDVESYAMQHLVRDVLAVLDDAGVARGVLVGHDWGANVVWQTTAQHPDRVRSLVAVCIPYRPRSPAPPRGIMENTLRFFEGALASVPRDDHAALRQAFYRFLYGFSGDAPDGFIERLFAGARGPDPAVLNALALPPTPPRWLSEQDLDYYVQAYARTGFAGVLNRYRNLVRDWEDTADVGTPPIRPPTLFIGGDRDPAVAFGSLEPMKALVPDLHGISILPGCGHWVQQERANELNDALVGFLRETVSDA